MQILREGIVEKRHSNGMENSRGLHTHAARGDERLWKRRLCLTHSGLYLYDGLRLPEAHDAEEVEEEGVGGRSMGAGDTRSAGGPGSERAGKFANGGGRILEMLPIVEIAEVANATEWDFERNKTVLRCKE